jgi:hypothetical protein
MRKNRRWGHRCGRRWRRLLPGLTGMASANVSLRVDGDRVNGVEPWPEDAPNRATLTPSTSEGPGFSPSREATLDDVMSIPGSFDIVDLGTGEPGLPGYPRAPLLPTSYGQVVRGCRVDMFMGHGRAPTAEGDADHGWSGCSTTGPGQSLDGRKKLLYLIFPCPPSTT